MSKSYTVDMVSAIGRTALVLPRVLSSFKIESSDVTKLTLLYLNFRNRSQNVKKKRNRDHLSTTSKNSILVGPLNNPKAFSWANLCSSVVRMAMKVSYPLCSTIAV